MSWIEAVVRWYAVLVAMTWAFAPAVRWLCDRLADRGATVARPLAVLFAVYPAWLLASLGLVAFRVELIVATVAVAAGIGWVLTLRNGGDVWPWLRDLLAVEFGSLGTFLAYVWLRGFSPQILGTEKPMDIAFLASSMRAVAMPPPDPWFAGEPINYYYLGYLLHGTVGRLAAIPPEIEFNLALATIFSTTAVAAFGVAWNVVRPWAGRALTMASGAFAAFAVAIAGNLYAPFRLIQDVPATVSAWWWDSVAGIGWRSSRIVCDGPRVDNSCPFPATETINEFPFFSFLLGDLHPHVMALPYSLVAIALSWNLRQANTRGDLGDARRWWVRVALSGAVAGALYPLNAWDFPTFLLLMAVGAWIGWGAVARSAAAPIAVLVVSAVLFWLPFLATYVPPTTDATTGMPRIPGVSAVLSAVALHLGERTSLGEYLTIFGVPYGLGIALLVVLWRHEAGDGNPIEPRTVVIIGLATVVPGVILSAPVFPLCGIPLALAIILIRRIPPTTARAFALSVFAFAWALSIGVEIVYVRDIFDDRMNTLFKFYYQAWTLYAVAAAVTVAILWHAARSAPARAVLAAGTLAAVLAGMAYPVIASYQWTDGFASWQGLDGLAYGETTAPNEVAAIRWLGEHAEPGDIVLEAAGCSYLPFDRLPSNRVSAFTGVPTVIGWANHERQWRAGQPELIEEIGARQADVASIYADPSGPLGERYGVDWLFVGEYEAGDWQAECESAGPYDGIALPSFPGPGWDEAFRSGDVEIFRRSSD